jgi:sugar/nucleoside kinase (ribokinase family)
LTPRYQESAEYPTGKCAVLITGHDRSLVTNLEAANHFTVDHLDAADNWALVLHTYILVSLRKRHFPPKNRRYIYISLAL